MLIQAYVLEMSHEGPLIMLRHCDTQVARAHHRHNEENMLIADSSAEGKIEQSKHHLRCSRLVQGRDGQEMRQSEGGAGGGGRRFPPCEI